VKQDPRFLLAALAILGALGCTVLPPPVLAPRPASGVDGAVGFGTSYGFATATLRSPDGQEVGITGNGENTSVGNDNAAAVSGLFPAFAALRLATDGADAAMYIHWQRVGVNTRFEVASWDQQALGLRLAGSTDFRARAYDGSLAVEHVLPEVSGFQPFYQPRLVLGRAHHKLVVPRELDATAHLDNRGDVAGVHVYRHELRAELTFAVTRRIRGSSLTVGLAPSLVLMRGSLHDVECSNCIDGTTLLDFSQTFSLALLLSLGVDGHR
jgi:hypothetical protein